MWTWAAASRTAAARSSGLSPRTLSGKPMFSATVLWG